MKQKDIASLVAVGLAAAVFSLFASKLLFSSGQKPSKVPVVQAVSPEFPDVKNDSAYTPIFNNKALDPTQLIQIGNTQNNTPFNGR